MYCSSVFVYSCSDKLRLSSKKWDVGRFINKDHKLISGHDKNLDLDFDFDLDFGFDLDFDS